MRRGEHIVVVPGLIPKHHYLKQERLFEKKREQGFLIHLLKPRWYNDESSATAEQEIGRLTDEVDEIIAQFGRISFYAYSIGGAATICLLNQHHPNVNTAVLVAPKVTGAEIRNARDAGYHRDAPRALATVAMSEEILARGISFADKITLRVPWNDRVVPRMDTFIQDADTSTVAMPGHAAGIVFETLRQFR